MTVVFLKEEDMMVHTVRGFWNIWMSCQAIWKYYSAIQRTLKAFEKVVDKCFKYKLVEDFLFSIDR